MRLFLSIKFFKIMKEIMTACEIFQNRFLLIKKNVEDYISTYQDRKHQAQVIKNSWHDWQQTLAFKILDKKPIDDIFILECLGKIIQHQKSLDNEKRSI
jgi:hypothetical protein